MERIEMKPSTRILLAILGALVLCCLGTGWIHWSGMRHWQWFFLIDLAGLGLGIAAIAGYRFRSRLVGAALVSAYLIAFCASLFLPALMLACSGSGGCV